MTRSHPRTFREFFAFLGVGVLIGYAILWRHEIFAWLMSSPGVMWALLIFGAALTLGAVIVGADELIERVARKRAGECEDECQLECCADGDTLPDTFAAAFADGFWNAVLPWRWRFK